MNGLAAQHFERLTELDRPRHDPRIRRDDMRFVHLSKGERSALTRDQDLSSHSRTADRKERFPPAAD